MEFIKSLSFGYQVMLFGIGLFIVGVIVILIENKTKKRTPEQIKNEYMVKNNVRSSDNPTINNNSISLNPSTTNDQIKLNTTIPDEPVPTEQNLNINPPTNNNGDSDLMNMYK